MSGNRFIPLTVSDLKERVIQMHSSAQELGSSQELNVRASSMGEAERKGRAQLRQANKNEVTGTIRMQGSVHMVSGVTLTLRGAGVFDGKYIVDKATHSVNSGGHVVSLDVHRVLEGY